MYRSFRNVEISIVPLSFVGRGSSLKASELLSLLRLTLNVHGGSPTRPMPSLKDQTAKKAQVQLWRSKYGGTVIGQARYAKALNT